MTRSPAVVAALFVLATSPRLARADDSTKEACIEAHPSVQRFRRTGALRDALRAATECGRDACPRLVVTDCATWVTELEALVPTVVFEARDSAGNEVSDVRVSIDGKPLVDRLDGKAVAL